MGRLTQEKVWRLLKRKEKGLSSILIAKQLNISKRRVNQIWKDYKTTGKFDLQKVGRPATRVLSKREKTRILKLHEHQMVGARIIGKLMRFRYGAKIGNNLGSVIKQSTCFEYYLGGLCSSNHRGIHHV